METPQILRNRFFLYSLIVVAIVCGVILSVGVFKNLKEKSYRESSNQKVEDSISNPWVTGIPTPTLTAEEKDKSTSFDGERKNLFLEWNSIFKVKPQLSAIIPKDSVIKSMFNGQWSATDGAGSIVSNSSYKLSVNIFEPGAGCFPELKPTLIGNVSSTGEKLYRVDGKEYCKLQNISDKDCWVKDNAQSYLMGDLDPKCITNVSKFVKNAGGLNVSCSGNIDMCDEIVKSMEFSNL